MNLSLNFHYFFLYTKVSYYNKKLQEILLFKVLFYLNTGINQCIIDFKIIN